MVFTGLVFQRYGGGRLKITWEMTRELGNYRQLEARTSEAGGVLLGRHLLGSEDIVIDGISLPQRGDRRGRFSFFRKRQSHQAIINQAWQESNGTCTYLGEWHTHPERNPSPSSIDLINWRKKLVTDQFTSCLFFIIVGVTEIRVWEGYRSHSHIYPLSQIKVNDANP